MKFQTNHSHKYSHVQPSEAHIVHSMRESIKLCWDCRYICQQTFFQHCLNEGGNHVEKQHVKIMMDCIDICQTAADFMTRGSYMHPYVCAACADVCAACAKSCEYIGGDEMMHCAEICWRCADSCREMTKAENII